MSESAVRPDHHLDGRLERLWRGPGGRRGLRDAPGLHARRTVRSKMHSPISMHLRVSAMQRPPLALSPVVGVVALLLIAPDVHAQCGLPAEGFETVSGIIYEAISEFPKWRKYLISLSFRGQSSVRPVQVGGFDVNIDIHRSTAVRGRGGPARHHAWPPYLGAILAHTDGPCGS